MVASCYPCGTNDRGMVVHMDSQVDCWLWSILLETMSGIHLTGVDNRN